MIQILSIGVAVLLLSGIVWVAVCFRRWMQDRARLQQEISELTTHAQVLQEGSAQPIVRFENARFENAGLIRAVNPAAEHLFGYPASELLGQNIAQLVPEALTATRLTGTLEVRCKDGSRLRLPFRAVKSELVRTSYIYLFFESLLAEDPPPKAAPRDSIAPSERAAAGERSASAHSPLWYAARIVGRIAFQFESLLTTISGYSELALMETPEGSPLRQELEELVTASDRASALARHLVAFSGGQLVPVEPVDLTKLVKDMQAQLRQTIPRPIDFDLQPMEKESLANADYLREVILLLCASACGRMRPTDRLRVRTQLCDFPSRRLIQGGSLKAGTYGTLSISDSGRPLDTQIKEHLFEPLYLIHKDMGVELSPIYGIVQSLGGGIDVVTGDDIGTTFEILLPCVASAQAASA